MKITMTVDLPLTQDDFDDYADCYDWEAGDEDFKRFISGDLFERIFDCDDNCDVLSVGTDEELNEIVAKVHQNLDDLSKADLRKKIRALEAELEELKTKKS